MNIDFNQYLKYILIRNTFPYIEELLYENNDWIYIRIDLIIKRSMPCRWFSKISFNSIVKLRNSYSYNFTIYTQIIKSSCQHLLHFSQLQKFLLISKTYLLFITINTSSTVFWNQKKIISFIIINKYWFTKQKLQKPTSYVGDLLNEQVLISLLSFC
jgi:hypothetical protein